MFLNIIVPSTENARGNVAAIQGTIGWPDEVETGPGVKTLGYAVEPGDAPAMLAAVRDLNLPDVVAGLEALS